MGYACGNGGLVLNLLALVPVMWFKKLKNVWSKSQSHTSGLCIMKIESEKDHFVSEMEKGIFRFTKWFAKNSVSNCNYRITTSRSVAQNSNDDVLKQPKVKEN